jgi:hypothetical protein
MIKSSVNLDLPRSAIGVMIGFGAVSSALLGMGRADYPQVHTILDTSMTLVTGVLTLLLWDLGARTDRPFPKQLAIGFAVTLVLECFHIVVTIDWSGSLAPIAGMQDFLRPITWPPPAHALPIAIVAAVWLTRAPRVGAAIYAVVMLIMGVALVETFRRLPTYTLPGPLSITRPALIFAPMLWVVAGLMCWRERESDRIFQPLAVMAKMLFLGNTLMLYSQAPHDSQAIVAHLGSAAGGLVLLLSLMRMATLDMLERIRSEKMLMLLNEQLEHRVLARTAELESINRTLQTEVDQRRQAEQRAQNQLRRTDLLHRIIRAIGERKDLSVLLGIVVQSLEEQLSADFVCFCFYDGVDETLVVARVGHRCNALALELGLPERARIDANETGFSQVISGIFTYIPDLSQIDSPFANRLAGGTLRSLMLVPLKAEDQIFGVLMVARVQMQGFNNSEGEFLQQLGEHLALVVHQAQL